MSDTILKMDGISKSFGGVQALKDIHFDLKEGEVHALVGENGAGKSTLIKILGGVHKPDEGKIYIRGEEKSIQNVEEAKRCGISIIHQEIVLVPELSVYENIFLGSEKTKKFGFLNKGEMLEKAREMLDTLGLSIDPLKKVSELNIAQQQMVEITKAVSFNVKILVMDEPTSSLSSEEVDDLFKFILTLKKKNISIIYISHRFEEIFNLSDRITVLRDGKYIDTLNTNETDSENLVNLMVGRKVDKLYSRGSHFSEDGKEVLRVENLCSDKFEDISFSVKEGEIVGFSGLIGSGRSEVMETIFGARKYDSGSIYLYGEKTAFKNCKEAIENHLALVPENRKEQGLILEQSINFNQSLASLDNYLKNGFFIDENKKAESTESYIEKLSIKTDSQMAKVSSLSGGNQQKVVIAKWLLTNPRLLILDEPTRGVDVGARSEIYKIIDDLTKDKMAIILISSDLPELINIADRTYVMHEGRITGHLDKNEMTQENIMKYATKGKENE